MGTSHNANPCSHVSRVSTASHRPRDGRLRANPEAARQRGFPLLGRGSGANLHSAGELATEKALYEVIHGALGDRSAGSERTAARNRSASAISSVRTASEPMSVNGAGMNPS